MLQTTEVFSGNKKVRHIMQIHPEDRNFPDYSKIILQKVNISRISSKTPEMYMLRLDLLHPEVSGNKWFKLKYNIEEAIKENKTTLLTFGGPRSNHIAATAAAAPLFGLKSIGLIRGLPENLKNPTLNRAIQNGMRIRFLDRESYRHKEEDSFLSDLKEKFPDAFIVPEGGKNLLGMKGAGEILDRCPAQDFTHICCAVGTGSTLAGIIGRTQKGQHVLGFSALKKAEEQKDLIRGYLENNPRPHGSWEISTAYHFGGFAKRRPVLDQFLTNFEKETRIPLDFVYTGKMMYGILDLLEKGYFPRDAKILIIHTGGLQGNLRLSYSTPNL